MKRCGKCGLDKPPDEFHRWSREGRQPWCKICRKAYDAAYHQRVRERRKEQKRLKKIEFLAWYRAMKEASPCSDCGGRFPHPAMQYDHLPGTDKRGELGFLVRHCSRQLVLDEIAKCELVCANCHAIRTFTRGLGQRRERPVEAVTVRAGPWTGWAGVRSTWTVRDLTSR